MWIRPSMPSRSTNAPKSTMLEIVPSTTSPGDEPVEDRLPLLLALVLEDGAARQHDVVARAVELDHLAAQLLAEELVQVLDAADVDQRRGQEAAHAEVEDQAALDDLDHAAVDRLAALGGALDLLPRELEARALLRQDQPALGVLLREDERVDLVPDADLVGRVDRAPDRELGDRDDALRLVADVDQHLVLVDAYDGAVHDLPLGDGGEARVVVRDHRTVFGGHPDVGIRGLRGRCIECLGHERISIAPRFGAPKPRSPLRPYSRRRKSRTAARYGVRRLDEAHVAGRRGRRELAAGDSFVEDAGGARRRRAVVLADDDERRARRRRRASGGSRSRRSRRSRSGAGRPARRRCPRRSRAATARWKWNGHWSRAAARTPRRSRRSSRAPTTPRSPGAGRRALRTTPRRPPSAPRSSRRRRRSRSGGRAELGRVAGGDDRAERVAEQREAVEPERVGEQVDVAGEDVERRASPGRRARCGPGRARRRRGGGTRRRAGRATAGTSCGRAPARRAAR